MNSPANIPEADFGAVFDAHLNAEFVTHDLDATMATMSDSPHLTHVPVLTGGSGRDEIRHFYGKYFIGHWPADTAITHLTRTVGQGRLVDELIVSFTHDVEMPAMLPGVKPTGKKVSLPHVVIAGFEDGKVAYEHIYWDQLFVAPAGEGEEVLQELREIVTTISGREERFKAVRKLVPDDDMAKDIAERFR